MDVSNMCVEGRNIATERKIKEADSMLMTTTQWGAVAYLTKALGTEPLKNPSAGYITGNGDYKANVNQSTTGNVTGIYDMAGCAWETMSSYLNNGVLTNKNGQNLIINKNTKYVDVYTAGTSNTQASNYAANADKYGDAQYEVSSNGLSIPLGWSGDDSNFPYSTGPVLYRGGAHDDTGSEGVFAFDYNAGQSYDGSCWRRSFYFIASCYN